MKRAIIAAVFLMALSPPSLAQNVDVTGRPLRLELDFVDSKATQLSAHIVDAGASQALRNAVPKLFAMMTTTLPLTAGPLASTPLNAQYDRVWAGETLPGNQKTLHDAALDVLSKQLMQAGCPKNCVVSKVESVSLPTTGRVTISPGLPTDGPLDAANGQHDLRVDYLVQGAQAVFDAGALGASWKLTFDVDVYFHAAYGLTPCSFQVLPMVAGVGNAKISANNAGATVDQALGDAVLWFEQQIPDIFSTAKASIDSTPAQPVGDNPLAIVLGLLGGVCSAEEFPLGFKEFHLAADPQGGFLMRLTMPAATAPLLTLNGTAPSLFHPLITLPTSEVSPGATIAISGKDFNINTVDGFTLSWTSNLATNPAMPIATMQATPPVQGVMGSSQTYTVAKPATNTNYDFQVQTCNALTCAPLSNKVQVNTAGATSGEVQLVLQQGAKTVDDLGSAVIGSNGSFAKSATLAANLAPGAYVLEAQSGGKTLASTPLTVVAAKSAAPKLEFVDPTTKQIYTNPRLGTNNYATLQAEGFKSGDPVEITLDSPTGKSIVPPVAPKGSPPTFQTQIRIATPGNHVIFATQGTGASALKASINVVVQQY